MPDDDDESGHDENDEKDENKTEDDKNEDDKSEGKSDNDNEKEHGKWLRALFGPFDFCVFQVLSVFFLWFSWRRQSFDESSFVCTERWDYLTIRLHC